MIIKYVAIRSCVVIFRCQFMPCKHWSNHSSQILKGRKQENEFCYKDNCDKGLECKKEDDGCPGTEIGRCVKGI